MSLFEKITTAVWSHITKDWQNIPICFASAKNNLAKRLRRNTTPTIVPPSRGTSCTGGGTLKKEENSRHKEPDIFSLIASLAIETWRLRRRMERLAEKLGEDNLRPLRESMRRLNDLLLQNRVELREHDGQIFTEGLQFEVIHIREQADPLVVVETVTPSVIFCDRIIRHGQVILGSSRESEDKGDDKHNH